MFILISTVAWWYIPSIVYSIDFFHSNEKNILNAFDISLPVAMSVIRSFSELSIFIIVLPPTAHHPPEAKYIVIGHVLVFKNSISFSTYWVSIEDS